MIESRTRCVACQESGLRRFYTYWECPSCGQHYPCVAGIPKLYLESAIGDPDRTLRDRLYDSLLGRFYGFLWPLLSIPVRPVRISLIQWAAYFLVVLGLGFLFWRTGAWLLLRRLDSTTLLDVLLLTLLAASILFLSRHPYLWKLLVLAIPTKISLALHPFQAIKSFKQIHTELQEEYHGTPETFSLLDVATGSCNSLFRHGWMDLDAHYVGVDLSKDMLLQGARFMTAQNVPVDFMLADAQVLPFEPETFDIVTCYGAVNGFTAPEKALKEMVRVVKKGGKILFLDEQLYEAAT